MHGYEPGSVTPGTESVLAHTHPQDRAAVADLIERVRRHGATVSTRHRIIDTGGAQHLVIAVGDRFCDDGVPAGSAGFYIDITGQFNADTQARRSDAEQAISVHRAVIDQAIGVLMLRYGLTAESAFQLLARLSEESNVKLPIIAQRVVAKTAARGTLPESEATGAVKAN